MKKILVLAFTALLAFPMAITAKMKVHSLKCENMNAPLGINTTLPRFSWKNESNRPGERQTAWEIQVASDLKLLKSGKADLWKSGKNESAEQVLVDYKGKPLRSRQLCFWRVRTWDADGRPTAWSSPQRFSIGLIEGIPGSYIGLPQSAGDIRTPLLRKNITISPKAKAVFAHVNSLGYHEIYVNGKKVGDEVLTPAVSQLDKHSQIVTYDLTPYISKGTNDIVIWLGQGWYKSTTFKAVYGGPLMKVQIDELSDGNWTTLATSSSDWKGTPGGYGDTGTWHALQFGGERVIGDIVPTSLNSSTLDKMNWHPVHSVCIPDMVATPQCCTGNIIIARTKPASIQSLGQGKWLVDMGRVLTGWLQLNMKGLKAGQEINMEYSDYLPEDGIFVSQNENDAYVAAGRPEETFCNKFHHHAYRYVCISGLDVQPDCEALQISGNYEAASSFACSDDDLNTIHNMINYTMRCLAFSGYMVDCPHLERTGYGGDGNSSTMTLQTMYDVAPLFHNWLQAWNDVIDADGSLPHVAPAGGGGGGPYWCGFMVMAPWRTWLNYADNAVAQNCYNQMKMWLGYVKKYSRDGLLTRWPDTANRMWYLGDWLAPMGVDAGDERSVNLVSNCLVSECLQSMSIMAERLGHHEDALTYRTWHENINRTIHLRFFNAADNTYATGSPLDMAYPMLVGAVPEEKAEAVKEQMRKLSYGKYKSHIAVGLVGVPIFTEYVVRNHETELMYDILKKRDYPGYLYMIDNGATATWEYWNGERSHVHNCYNGIGTWFYQALGGIVPDPSAPGYRHFRIDPQYAEKLTWTRVTKETPYGTISVDWKKENGKTTLNVAIPVGTTATTQLPKHASSCTVDGTPVGGQEIVLTAGIHHIVAQ